jgi:hypothetical protein
MFSCIIQTGIIPKLVNTLTTHRTLAQAASDANVTYELLAYLLRCKAEFFSVSSLVSAGALPEAVHAFDRFETLLDSGPTPINQAHVMTDVKVSSPCLVSVCAINEREPAKIPGCEGSRRRAIDRRVFKKRRHHTYYNHGEVDCSKCVSM